MNDARSTRVRLPTEHELSEQLGVSRTVVREAVKVLVATGLVYTRRGSGLYVANKISPFATTMLDALTPFDPSNVISLYEFRLTLEHPPGMGTDPLQTRSPATTWH